ncbi:hypothetical protein AAG747_12275 [Rapidithrix thailandica]|uniref:Uncharacterized protein n=1 Tax=Rapidithrix thailandica TaxID=413964 RepID=A0AAW9S5C2_9BACT
MAKKYKLKVGNKPTSEEEVKQFKNFDRVLNQYRRRKPSQPVHLIVYRLNKHLPLLILIIIFLVIAYFFFVKQSEDKTSQPGTPKSKNEQPVSSPLKE